jgi:hypothetical protein
MAWPRHALVHFGGSLPGPETWSCGIRTSGSSTGFLPDPDSYLNDIFAGLSSWFSNVANMVTANATLQYVKANNINATGHYNDPVTHVHSYTGTINGGASSQVVPFVAMCYSWTTAAARGIAHTGRIYMPVTTTGVQGTSVAAPADVTKYVNAAHALLLIISNGSGATANLTVPSVVSPGAPSNGNLGVIRQINGVRVGNVFDVQRRRKAQIPEVYTALAYP